MKGLYRKLALAAALTFISNYSIAFQFEFLWIKDPVHQDMAEFALNCFIKNPSKHRFICEGNDFVDGPKFYQGDVSQLDKLTVSDIREAVTWSDDPVRELRKRKPHKVLLWTFRLIGDECGNYRGGLKDGLRCTTHYGNLQFMHSMESLKDESPIETQKAILDWVEYAYNVALNQKKEAGYNNDNDYCTYFKSDNPSKFQKAMAPQNTDASYQFPCNQSDNTPWQLGTFFALSCWWGSSICSEYTYGNNYLVRKSALGAVLHAIQDSYAKGHTSRGNDKIDRINTFECAPIRQFQLYTEQDHEAHGEADTYPKPSVSCLNLNSDDIDGPVTASAEVIRLFFSNENSGVVRKYLAEHVFKLSKNADLAGVTKLFELEDHQPKEAKKKDRVKAASS